MTQLSSATKHPLTVTPALINIAMTAAFALMIILGMKRFIIWDQIIDIFNQHTPLLDLFHNRHPHALRYLLMLPVLQLASLFGTDPSWIYSWVVLMVLFGISRLQMKTIEVLRPERSAPALAWDGTLLLACWYVIGFFMNGRLALMFLGISLILYAQTCFLAYQRRKYFSILLQVAGLLLCSVSSGTFTIAFAVILTFLITLPLSRLPQRKIAHLDIVALGLLLGWVCLPLVQIYVAKNVLFDNGSLSQMLLHGPPALLYQAGISLEALTVIYFIFFFSMFFLTIAGNFLAIWNQWRISPLILLVGYALMIGIFGYSSLLTCLPGLIVIGMYKARA